jgi:hypothetical protein
VRRRYRVDRAVRGHHHEHHGGATATPTTVPPMTAEELAWLKLIPTVSKKIDKTFETTTNLTTRGMTKLA